MTFNRRWQDAFFMFSLVLMVLISSACTTRAVRTGRSGIFDDPRRPTKYSSVYERGAYEDGDRTEEIHLTGKWAWPLKSVEVSSPYGNRGHKFHQGVDLRAPMRTPVLAANDGTVVYVGSKIRGYGRMVVIKHADNFYTVYAHHSKNLVKVGKQVSRGEKIALSGKSGHSTGPHLHFEIRQGTESYDPIFAINDNLQKSLASRRIASEKAPQ